MLKNSLELEEKAKACIEELNAFCLQNDLVGKVQADHLDLKCSNAKIFEFQRALFEHTSTFIYQSIISKRRIAIIGLADGLDTVVGSLNYLELSDQKPDGSQIDHIDHVEIVPITISYEQLVEQLLGANVPLKEIVRPHHSTFDVVLSSGFVIKLSRGMLIDKIKTEEMK